VASDAGLLLPRELDERLSFGALIERHRSDPRTGRNAQFTLADLFRESIYSRPAGYEDTNDAERLALDPTFRMLASRERRDTSVALTPEQSATQPRTADSLSQLPLPGCLLGPAASGDREGRASSRRTLPPRGFHRHQLDRDKPGYRPLL